jgi:penicillin-binding protein 1A
MYLIDSLLMDVVKKGTARKALVLERNDIAGKTGTTNGPTDAWFSGYNPNIVTTAWVGFDQYEMLGKREYGGSAALPIWIDYMRVALSGKPDLPRPRPNGLVSVRIDPTTGALASPGQENAIFEVFLEENVPQESKSSKQSNGGSNSYNQIDEGGLF